MIIAMTMLALAGAPAAAGSTEACRVDLAAMLKLTPVQFDQEQNGGWRALAARRGCASAAADLIGLYRKARWGTLTAPELHISYWHEGQMRAYARQVDRAVPLILAGVNPEMDFGMSEYALGTVAFLRGDLQGLKAARARLASLPAPEIFKQSGTRWPLNLDILDGLIVCFDRPYAEAYGAAECTPR